ncbi:hypothetical protein Sjap_012741 [Stephania japonica]|uniref:Uncharacterized protein n=1 Tax=Stephania japonica TaxID=461633 RepID=A0AAP0IWM6_9MAGN
MTNQFAEILTNMSNQFAEALRLERLCPHFAAMTPLQKPSQQKTVSHSKT